MKSEEKDDLLAIDIHNLENDASSQPRLIRIWIDKLAHAEKKAKLAKRELRLVKAELSKSVRSSPSKYGIVKLTDTSVEDAVVCMSTYKAKEEEYIDVELSRDIIKSMVQSLHERGEQISNEVKLHGQGYFSKVSVDPDTMQKIQEQGRLRATKATNKKNS